MSALIYRTRLGKVNRELWTCSHAGKLCAALFVLVLDLLFSYLTGQMWMWHFMEKCCINAVHLHGFTKSLTKLHQNIRRYTPNQLNDEIFFFSGFHHFLLANSVTIFVLNAHSGRQIICKILSKPACLCKTRNYPNQTQHAVQALWNTTTLKLIYLNLSLQNWQSTSLQMPGKYPSIHPFSVIGRRCTLDRSPVHHGATWR